MSLFDLPLCPCCTGAMLHTLAQHAGWLTSQSLLELGKGALIAKVGTGEQAESLEQLQLTRVGSTSEAAEVIVNSQA